MPDITTRLGLKKPLASETVSRTAFNENWDLIDEKTALKSDLETHETDTAKELANIQALLLMGGF